MDDFLRQARLVLRGMWLHRHLGAVAAWAFGIVAALVIFLIPDKYEASARIYVDTDSVLKPLLSGIAVQPNTDQQVFVLSRTLISRPNIEKLVRMADLDLSIKTKEARDDLVDDLMKTLTIKSTGRDNLYTLSFRDPDPTRATKIVQSLTTIFVESSLGDKRQDSDSARKFIDEQIKAYEKKLEDAETRLKAFKLRNLEVAGGEGDFTGKIGDTSARLAQARLELREAENSREAIRRQILGDFGPGSSASSDALTAMPEIDSRIDAVQRNLDTLLQRYTEQHPDVVGARRTLKELEDQKKQEIAARRKAAVDNPNAAFSNVSPQLKVNLAAIEANIASLRTRVAEYEARYKRMLESMKMQPQIEAEFAQLNRDYEIHKKNYEGLVSRRESASISGEVETMGGMADFKLIDPPRASSHPVAPNRLLLLPLALLASILFGAGICFVACQVRPTFSDARTLRDTLGVPVLGTVTLVVSQQMRSQLKRSLMRLGAAVGGLVGSYTLAMLVVLLLASRTA